MGGPYTPDAQLIDDRMTAIFLQPSILEDAVGSAT